MLFPTEIPRCNPVILLFPLVVKHLVLGYFISPQRPMCLCYIGHEMELDMSTINNEVESQSQLSGGSIVINGSRLPARIFIFLLLAEVLLVLLDAFVNYAEWSKFGTIRRLFNITREDGLASWFMVTQTFVVALILWLIFFLQRNRGVSRKRIAGWGFLAGFFTYMSADDGAMIHERLGTLAEKMFESDTYGYAESLLGRVQALFPSYEWQLVAMPLLAAAGLFMLFFLWREFSTRGERLLLLTSAGFMALAVGLDFVEGLEFKHPLNVAAWVGTTFDLTIYTVKHFSKSLEEFLEMLAMSVLLMLVLRHLIRISGPSLTFHCSKAGH